ncbi:MAG: hypothetical protein KGL39_54310 [Patescibacteria group bacterium]|nr:hypothetical protein [Patescibacteria group bacterium]
MREPLFPVGTPVVTVDGTRGDYVGPYYSDNYDEMMAGRDKSSIAVGGIEAWKLFRGDNQRYFKNEEIKPQEIAG